MKALETILDEMKGLIKNKDKEAAHSMADDLLCDAIEMLGALYPDVGAECELILERYYEIDKWCA